MRGWEALPLMVGAVAALLNGCHRGVVPTGEGLRFVLDSSGRTSLDTGVVFAMDTSGVTVAGSCPDTMPVDTAHAVSRALLATLLSNGYCNWFIPEYDDEQQFRTGNGTYGPLAQAFATPFSANYHAVSAFSDPQEYVNVAIVDVSAPPGTILDRPYSVLGLRGGRNCVFLHYEQATKSWQGAVKNGDGALCETGDSPPQSVHIIAEKEPGAPASAYPPVARFIEGNGDTTFIGIRCADAFCVVIGVNAVNVVPDPAHKGASGAGTSRRWKIKGWFDEQHLAVLPKGSRGAMIPKQLASIVPDDDLGSYTLDDYTGGWPSVATVFLKDNPEGKYGLLPDGTGYGFVKGAKNHIWMHAKVAPGGTATDAVWTIKIGKDLATARPHQVFRTDHSAEGYPVPATARWRWAAGDEQMWIECLVGCCRGLPVPQ